MYNNRITDTGAAAIGDALKDNGARLREIPPQRITLGHPTSPAPICAYDAPKQCRAGALRDLTLSSNSIGDVGASALAEGIRAHPALRRLDLYFNRVGDAGAAALASALGSNKALAELNLDSNKIGDVGATALADALGKNTALVALTLGYNKIKNEGALKMEAAARADKSLLKLKIGHNQGVWGAATDALAALGKELDERRSVAEWLEQARYTPGYTPRSRRDLDSISADLAQAELADGVSAPALLSPYAEPARSLRVYKRAGAAALRGLGADGLRCTRCNRQQQQRRRRRRQQHRTTTTIQVACCAALAERRSEGRDGRGGAQGGGRGDAPRRALDRAPFREPSLAQR